MSKVTLSGAEPDPNYHGPAPQPIDQESGQHGDYWVLSEEERTKGFIRPVRDSYLHLTCGHITTMNRAIAETYAKSPGFYSATFCYRCVAHFPVGEDGEFVWVDKGITTTEKVGT